MAWRRVSCLPLSRVLQILLDPMLMRCVARSVQLWASENDVEAGHQRWRNFFAAVYQPYNLSRAGEHICISSNATRSASCWGQSCVGQRAASREATSRRRRCKLDGRPSRRLRRGAHNINTGSSKRSAGTRRAAAAGHFREPRPRPEREGFDRERFLFCHGSEATARPRRPELTTRRPEMERLGRVRRRFRRLERVHLHSPEAAVRRLQQARFNGASRLRGPRRPRPGPAEERSEHGFILARQRREGQGAVLAPPGVAQGLLLADGLLISANSGSLGREILVARYCSSTSSTTRRSASALNKSSSSC